MLALTTLDNYLTPNNTEDQSQGAHMDMYYRADPSLDPTKATLVILGTGSPVSELGQDEKAKLDELLKLYPLMTQGETGVRITAKATLGIEPNTSYIWFGISRFEGHFVDFLELPIRDLMNQSIESITQTVNNARRQKQANLD